MAKENLGALKVEKKSGREPFHQNGRPLPFTVNDFWQWHASDLATNALRGVVAEYLVACALGLTDECRLEWDACDLTTPEGLKVEVKSAGYIQRWAQPKLSQIRFDIKPTLGWDAKTNFYDPELKRHADVYVFCLFKHQDQATLDPCDLTQWEFLVLPTSTLNQKIPSQKTIGLNPLNKLNPEKTAYSGLAAAIKQLAK